MFKMEAKKALSLGAEIRDTSFAVALPFPIVLKFYLDLKHQRRHQLGPHWQNKEYSKIRNENTDVTPCAGGGKGLLFVRSSFEYFASQKEKTTDKITARHFYVFRFSQVHGRILETRAFALFFASRTFYSLDVRRRSRKTQR